ncbi:MAG: histidinol-phosphate transaminase [Cytophagales bacterium]|nr:histidinol-phosphate transaminase [Bernardetiaceae bacterium]MDW8210744.1 histidinol-phosphate transaminase [Cytophagales bacterium]
MTATRTFSLSRLMRPHIATLKPYSSARDEYSGSEGIFLDANENPWGSVTTQLLNRYPDPYQQALKSRIAELKHVPQEKIFLGNGSDEAIDLLYRAFCEPYLDNVIICPPTYGMYEVSAEINCVEVRRIPLSADFQLRPDAIIEAADWHTKMLFICSPNNPTANSMHLEDIRFLLERFEGLVVIDEAYIDFSQQPSCITLLEVYPNIVVLQTFSKAWGLAALRLGMAFASAEIIGVLNKIKPPYNVSGVAQRLALEGLNNQRQFQEMVSQTLEQRQWLSHALACLPEVLHVYPSDANFLLVKVKRPKEMYDFLISRKIIVRDRSRLALCEGCLRITVGTAEENQQLVAAMSQF